MNPFWMVLADLRKTFAASLGILVLLALAFSATVTVSLFERGLRQAGAASARDFDLVVGAPGSRLDLVLASVFLRTDEVLPLVDGALADQLAADPRVAVSSPLVFSDHWNGHPIVGVGPAFPRLRPALSLGAGRWPTTDYEVVAGASTGAVLGQSFEGAHGVHEVEGVEEEHHHEARFTVVGVLSPTGSPWDGALLTPYQGLWHLHEDPAGLGRAADHRVSAILVKPRDFPAAYALRGEYREGSTTAAFPGEVLAGLFALFDDVKQALSLFCLVFQVLVFAAVLLSLLASLPAKVRWIGLLRALGAGPAYIFLTLWIQSAVVFSAAVVVGAGAGWAGAQAVAAFVGAKTGLAIGLGWSWSETGLLGLFWAAGWVGALVPAAAGYRTSVRRSLLAL